MSNLLRGRGWKVGAVVLSGCVLAAGVVASSSSGARTAFKVDHQLCYSAFGKFLKVPPAGKVRLINQFVPNGFIPKISPTLAEHCNPVQKTVDHPSGPQVFPVTNPRAHLGCFPITEPVQKTWKVLVGNQFGQSILITGQPNRVCLPTWTSMTGPPTQTSQAPPGLNHFTCYPVTLAPGALPYQPPPVMLKDQWGQNPSQVLPIPNALCLPTKKLVTTAAGVRTYGIIDPVMHLLCFPGVKHQFKPNPYDKNQFGTAKLTVRISKSLCLPSTKQVLGPAG